MDSSECTMRSNPNDAANPISKTFFLWTIPMFRAGYTKVMDIADLLAPKNSDKSGSIGSTLARHWDQQVKKCKHAIKTKNITDPKKMPRPSLARALLATLKWHFIWVGFLLSITIFCFRLAQPLMLGILLSYFKPRPEISREQALLAAGNIVLLVFLCGVSMNHYMLGTAHLGMRARVAVCSLIYRKSLKLSRTALGDSTPGKVVNLLSNDVNRFDSCAFYLHYLWVAPIAALLLTALLLRELGASSIIGVFVVFTVMPLQGYTGKLSARFRLQTALRTDERVRLMGEIISGVQVIKMYTWERPFSRLIVLARRMELKIVRKNSYVRALFMSFMLFTTRAATYCTIASLVLCGEKLTATKVFVSVQYFTLMSNVMSSMFARAINETSEVWVSIGRLEAFLTQDEFVAASVTPSAAKINGDVKDIASLDIGTLASDDIKESQYGVKLVKASAKWFPDDEDLTLDIVSLEAGRGKLIGVIGPVGSGKSSLLQAILGELPLSEGSVQVRGRVSYAAQEAWVFGSTVRQNILFGLPYDQFRYNEVVRVCSLQKDFQQFSHGDQTLLGDRGTSLSGGQKARINLARAVYREADIYLLDDPLSAVDAHVGRHLYDKCVRTHLRKSTRILVTHQLHYLIDADHIVVMNNGKIEMQGSYHDIANSSLVYARLLVPSASGDKAEEERDGAKERALRNRRQRSRKTSAISSKSIGSTSISSSNVDPTDNNLEETEQLEEEPLVRAPEASSKGAVKGSVQMHYLKAASSTPGLALQVLLFVAAQALASYFDYFVSYWVSQEERRGAYMAPQNTTILNQTELSVHPESPKLWSSNILLIIGGTTVVGLLVVALWRSVIFSNASIRASQKLHDLMFRGIIRSPMKFFGDNPSGRIMNRFSKDMGAVDELLPRALIDACQQLLTLAGAIVISAAVNPSFFLAFIVLSTLAYFLRKLYLGASKNIKRLEGITRSPVFTHLGSTLAGLPTIRVSGAQDIVQMEFDKLQDLHSSAYYMFISTNQGFGFALDMLLLLFVAIAIFAFFFYGTGLLGDKVGLAITQAMSLTFFVQYGFRQSAEVANQMMAVERLLEYTQLQGENGIKPDKIDERNAQRSSTKLRTFREPPRDWPERGRVQFVDVSMKYGPGDDDAYVLKRLNLTIEPMEKVGIVGRTGAGKSSLVQAMFRLAYVEGDVLIDGVNTGDITLEDLRRQLSIIPQDPMLFSGTLRRNLDPFEEYSDELLWQALDQVELKGSVPSPAGLEYRVMDGGANFSVGQRQLICLARALLRNNKLLMMDEATANVDPQTDKLIQQTIRTKFTDCTVLTIAHRLNTIMDSDKVLVMELGQLVEYGHPYQLMQKKGEVPEEDGYFRRMVLETGADSSAALEEVARRSYLGGAETQ